MASPAGLNESPHPKVGKFSAEVPDDYTWAASLNESPHPKVGK